MTWETVIGLEIHVQLATRSKLFSGARNGAGAPPNTRACAIDLGLPGTLPVLNREAVRMAVMLGLAVGGTIALRSSFARKHYFYPDLPKGYQISQYDQPVIHGGSLEFTLPDGATERLPLVRIHLEEDAGKSVHDGFRDCSGIDLNRAGTPLLEVVSCPELRSPAAASACLRELQALVRCLGISSADMEQGCFRCDANLSIRKQGAQELGTRTELKNLNSFRFVRRALEYEEQRHRETLEAKLPIHQETRLYDPGRDETRPMRGKEEARDYRYFPDPDLPPLEISPELIEQVRQQLPELPRARARRLARQYSLDPESAATLSRQPLHADYFEQAVQAAGGHPGQCLHWIRGELQAGLKRARADLGDSPVAPQQLGELVRRVADHSLTAKLAKQILAALLEGAQDLDTLVKQHTARPIDDPQDLDEIITRVLEQHPAQADQYRAGRHKLLFWLVGKVLAETRGRADPQLAKQLLQSRLDTGEPKQAK